MLLSSPLYFKAVTILARQLHKDTGSMTITKEVSVVSTSKEKKKEVTAPGMSLITSLHVNEPLNNFTRSLGYISQRS